MNKRFLYGVDSLRFICAFIVVMGHVNMPFLPLGPLGRPAEILWANLFNGPAAVIVFFLVSGLVIHLRQALEGTTDVDVAEFYARRFIRIGLPCVFTIVLYAATDTELPGVLWSVLCEAIYYAFYPFLLRLSKKVGWETMILVALAVVATVAVSNLELLAGSGNSYVAFGNMTWVIGLPVWLSGCWIAENIDRFSVPSFGKIMALRSGIFLLSVVLRMVKFHVPVPYGSNVFWLTLFAIPATIWLAYEIAYFSANPAPRSLESAGKWSFSLYLIHPAVSRVWHGLGLPVTFGTGIVLVMLVLLISWIFFILAERPSHMLARKAGKALQGRRRGLA